MLSEKKHHQITEVPEANFEPVEIRVGRDGKIIILEYYGFSPRQIYAYDVAIDEILTQQKWFAISDTLENKSSGVHRWKVLEEKVAVEAIKKLLPQIEAKAKKLYAQELEIAA